MCGFLLLFCNRFVNSYILWSENVLHTLWSPHMRRKGGRAPQFNNKLLNNYRISEQ